MQKQSATPAAPPAPVAAPLSIAGLRRELGLSLEAFALRLGLSSKGNMSLMERGLRTPTVVQALMIETLSRGRIDAGALNIDVRACRTQAGAGFLSAVPAGGLSRRQADAVSFPGEDGGAPFPLAGQRAGSEPFPFAGERGGDDQLAVARTEERTVVRQAHHERDLGDGLSVPDRVVVCATCDRRLDDATVRSCSFSDCPNAQAEAA